MPIPVAERPRPCGHDIGVFAGAAVMGAMQAQRHEDVGRRRHHDAPREADPGPEPIGCWCSRAPARGGCDRPGGSPAPTGLARDPAPGRCAASAMPGAAGPDAAARAGLRQGRCGDCKGKGGEACDFHGELLGRGWPDTAGTPRRAGQLRRLFVGRDLDQAAVGIAAIDRDDRAPGAALVRRALDDRHAAGAQVIGHRPA